MSRILAQSVQFIKKFPDIFRNILQYSAMFRYTDRHKDILRHIQALLGILSHIQTYSELCVTFAYTIVSCSEPQHIQNARHPQNSHIHPYIHNLRYIQGTGIVKTVYSSIFNNSQGYSGILMHIQPHLGIILFAKPSTLYV